MSFASRTCRTIMCLLLACSGFLPITSHGVPTRYCDTCATNADLDAQANAWVTGPIELRPPRNTYFLIGSDPYGIQQCYERGEPRLGWQYRAVSTTYCAPSPFPTLNAEPDSTDPTYYIRAGDLNGDGLRDLFVTGNTPRWTGDFVLLQQSGGTFNVLLPTPAEVAIASSWPLTDVSVRRDDLNLDGYFDFIIENVDDAVWNSTDQIVLTARNNGRYATKVVPLDERFSKVLSDVLAFLLKPTPKRDAYQGAVAGTCYDVFLPDFSTGWNTYDGTLPWSRGIYDRPGISFRYYQFCKPPRLDAIDPAVVRLLTNHANGLISAGLSCDTCAESARAAAESAGYASVIVSGSVAVQRAGWILTTILIADDVTVVGSVNDILIPVVAIVIGGAYVIEVVANSSLPEEQDRGPTDLALRNPMFGAPDPFNIDPNCKPNDPGNIAIQTKANGQKPSSTRLGKNLRKAGCPKPHSNAEAHHIVPQKSPSDSAGAARALLKRVGIDIDEAANGVWLPRSANIQTQARVHAVFRGQKYEEAVLGRLKDAESGGQSGVRAALDAIRQEIANGTFTF